MDAIMQLGIIMWHYFKMGFKKNKTHNYQSHQHNVMGRAVTSKLPLIRRVKFSKSLKDR